MAKQTNPKRKRKSKVSRFRHPFLYTVNAPDGSASVKKAWAKVIYGTKLVEFWLETGHVLRAIAMDGAGNTNKCAGAVCTYEHRIDFPHRVEGWVDFTYTRVFVASKLNNVGLPSECYVYEHNCEFVKLFDTPAGQRKLLSILEKGGPIRIKLHPFRARSEPGRVGTHRKQTGTRDPIRRLSGANLRRAVVQAGYYPAGNVALGPANTRAPQAKK